MTDEFKQAINATAWHGDKPYDAKETIRLRRACELLRELLPATPGRRRDVLDVGCGIGPLRPFLPAEEFRIVGLEISAQAAELARQNYDACEVCDAEQPWPIEPASVDGVHAGAVMEHVLDWHAPLNHANRVLRDDGLIVIAVPNLRYWKEIRRLIRGRQPHWLRCMKHVHAYTPTFLKELVGIHGFAPVAVEADRVNLPLLPRKSRWVRRRFAGWGSVLILAARLVRRVRVEDRDRAADFPNHKPVACRSIEIQ